MNTRTLVIVVVFLLIVVGMFLFAYFKSSEIETVDQSTEPQQQEPVAGPYDYIERIDAKHFFIDGTHTLAGEINMPTPCDLLTWETTIAESFPEQVTVDFKVINNAETCAQVITPQRFKVEYDASEDASVRARLNGRNIELNLIPAAEGETPDDFEIFIKG